MHFPQRVLPGMLTPTYVIHPFRVRIGRILSVFL
jgi:hypothetical protein